MKGGETMKRAAVLLSVSAVLLIAVLAYAQGPGWNYCPYCGQQLDPGSGYGMGPGMMGGGYGMGPGMMGPGYYQQNEACQKFFDETSGTRKDLHNKRFEYSEAVRNPKSTPESVAKLGKEIRELQEKIHSKAPQGCW
jgi:hypothetical protein